MGSSLESMRFNPNGGSNRGGLSELRGWVSGPGSLGEKPGSKVSWRSVCTGSASLAKEDGKAFGYRVLRAPPCVALKQHTPTHKEIPYPLFQWQGETH